MESSTVHRGIRERCRVSGLPRCAARRDGRARSTAGQPGRRTDQPAFRPRSRATSCRRSSTRSRKQCTLKVSITTAILIDLYTQARAGKVDLAISHYGHREAEQFILDGLGEWPRTIFSNQVALVGPPSGSRGCSRPRRRGRGVATDLDEWKPVPRERDRRPFVPDRHPVASRRPACSDELLYLATSKTTR